MTPGTTWAGSRAPPYDASNAFPVANLRVILEGGAMRWGLLLGVVLLAAPMPVIATAQQQDTVAASGKTRVVASRGGDGALCLELEHGRGTTVGCSEDLERHEPFVMSTEGAVGGAVVGEVAEVEVEWPDGARTRVPTVAHAKFEPARFFVAVHGTREPWLIRHLGADGALLAVTEHGDGPTVAGPRTLA